MAMTPGPDMEQDPRLAAIYRAGAEAGPPARLDNAIRAAARREVSAGPRRGGSRRWQWPLSLAAVLLLSVTMVTQMREQGADSPEALLQQVPPPMADRRPAPAVEAPRMASDLMSKSAPEPASQPDRSAARPEAAAERPSPAAPGTLAAVPASPAPAAAESQSAARSESGGAGFVEAPAPVAAESAGAAADAAMVRREVPAGMRAAPARPADPSPLRSAAKAPAAAALSVPPPEPLWRDLVAEPAARWIERIAELRRAGRTADADALAAEFRRRFPDVPLPAVQP